MTDTTPTAEQVINSAWRYAEDADKRTARIMKAISDAGYEVKPKRRPRAKTPKKGQFWEGRSGAYLELIYDD